MPVPEMGTPVALGLPEMGALEPEIGAPDPDGNGPEPEPEAV